MTIDDEYFQRLSNNIVEVAKKCDITQGAPEMQHSDMWLKSVPDVQFYFFTGLDQNSDPFLSRMIPIQNVFQMPKIQAQSESVIWLQVSI